MNELVRRAQTGGNRERELLKAEMMPQVRSMLKYYRQFVRPDEVDDIRQEAWQSVFERLPKVDTTVGNSVAHLVKYARFGIQNYFMYRKYREHDELPSGCFGGSSSFSNQVLLSVSMEQLMEKMTPMQKEVCEGLLDDRTLVEIGEGLGCQHSNISYHRKQIQKTVSRKLFGGKYA